MIEYRRISSLYSIYNKDHNDFTVCKSVAEDPFGVFLVRTP